MLNCTSHSEAPQESTTPRGPLAKGLESSYNVILGDGETPPSKFQTNAFIFALPMHSIGWSRRGMGETACTLLETSPLPQKNTSRVKHSIGARKRLP